MKTKLKVTCGKFLHFTKRGCVGPYHYCVKPLPLFIAVSVPTHASERSCICVLEVMYLCVRGMDSVSVSTIVRLYFGTVPTVWYFFFLLYFGTVPTVWYFLFFYYILELFRQCGIFCFSIIFWNCSDTGIFCFSFYYLKHYYQIKKGRDDFSSKVRKRPCTSVVYRYDVIN